LGDRLGYVERGAPCYRHADDDRQVQVELIRPWEMWPPYLAAPLHVGRLRGQAGRLRVWLAWEDRDDQGHYWGFGRLGMFDEPQGRRLSRWQVTADDGHTLFRDADAWDLPDGIDE
jgi:hypothetical protein